MSEEILNLNDVAANIREKVKQEYINLVPEKDWDLFITTTIKQFKEVELKKIAMDELAKLTREKVKNLLESKMINYDFDTDTNELMLFDDVFIKSLEKAAPQMFISMIKQMVFDTMSQMKYNNMH